MTACHHFFTSKLTPHCHGRQCRELRGRAVSECTVRRRLMVLDSPVSFCSNSGILGMLPVCCGWAFLLTSKRELLFVPSGGQGRAQTGRKIHQ